MDFYSEYKTKLRSADEAVKIVKDGDWVDYSSNVAFPKKLDEALAKRRDELHNVKVRGNLTMGPIQVIECDHTMEHFVYNTWHCSGYERKMCDQGRAFFTPMVFRNIPWYYKNFVNVNVAMISVTPMDKHGYFNLSGATGVSRAIIEKADRVIVEVNEALPRVRGGEGELVHISEVDYVVEAGYIEPFSPPMLPPSQEDIKIAEFILPHISDGTTIQLGIGGTPNALGALIAESDLKDLGMHTELCSDGFMAMAKSGKLTNRKKNFHNGKGVLGLAVGTREFYDWVDDNPSLAAYPMSYVNDPNVIAQNDNLISINGCLNVDLYGQVSSESSGLRQISGTGGQLDFVTGATMSKGGKSFLCMSSTFTDKKGQLHSRIVPHFNGDIITTPRSQSYYIVTEFGCVNLAGMSSWERAEKLISIAHPDFREELIKNAEEQRIWLPSNKR